MRPCKNCYRLIENNAESCPYCGASQQYEAPQENYQGTKCPHCGAYLYLPENGCKGCGYKKKNGILRIALFALSAFLMMGLILLLQK